MLFSDIVNQHYEALNEVDLQMVKYIHAHPKEMTTMGTNDFAKICHSSKSSVIRFTQKLGFTGFSELRNFLKWQNNPSDEQKEASFKTRIFSDAERTINYLKTNEDDLIFVLSLSGENQHLFNVLNVLSTYRSTIVSITTMQNNLLSGRADFSLYASSSRSPNPTDWWLQTASSFFLLIEAFAFGYVDYCRNKK